MDNAREMAEEMMDRHEEWNTLVAENKERWLMEFKRLLGKDQMFWGTTFDTYTMFKVFEQAFKETIDDCYKETKSDEPSEAITRLEIAYGLFGAVMDSTSTDLGEGASA